MTIYNPKYDKSDDVLDELGYKPGAIKKEEKGKSSGVRK